MGVAVMREPCERFISATFYIQFWNKDLLDAKALLDPKVFAKALLDDADLRKRWLYPGYHKGIPKCTWQQSAWVGKNTTVLCLPTVQKDLQKVLSKFAPSCQNIQLTHKNVNHYDPKDWFNKNTCDLVYKIYPDDLKLWKEHCGDRPVGDFEARKSWPA